MPLKCKVERFDEKDNYLKCQSAQELEYSAGSQICNGRGKIGECRGQVHRSVRPELYRMPGLYGLQEERCGALPLLLEG